MDTASRRRCRGRRLWRRRRLGGGGGCFGGGGEVRVASQGGSSDGPLCGGVESVSCKVEERGKVPNIDGAVTLRQQNKAFACGLPGGPHDRRRREGVAQRRPTPAMPPAATHTSQSSLGREKTVTAPSRSARTTALHASATAPPPASARGMKTVLRRARESRSHASIRDVPSTAPSPPLPPTRRSEWRSDERVTLRTALSTGRAAAASSGRAGAAGERERSRTVERPATHSRKPERRRGSGAVRRAATRSPSAAHAPQSVSGSAVGPSSARWSSLSS